jgi:3-phenylpropionate/trans-cinnamate dioxygenase ferredoxin subunit
MAVGNWLRVADASDIAPGEGLRVEIEDDVVTVWNVDGDFYATADTCTHEEASLSEGDLWEHTVECPLHGAQFDVRTGAVKSLPAIFPLATYAVKVESGTLYVEWKGR